MNFKLVVLEKFVPFGTSLLLAFILLGTPAFSKEIPRFDFAKSLKSYESHRDRYIERILFESSNEEFKKFRWEQITGIKDVYSSLYASEYGVHVTVLFNVTEYVPSGLNLRQHKMSFVQPSLEAIINSLSDREKKYVELNVLSEPEFTSHPSKDAHYEKLDLFVHKKLVRQIIDLPEFVDITFSGTNLGIAFRGETVRLAGPSRSFKYENSLLRRGYYKEIAEALRLQQNVNVHVQLNDGANLDDVVQDLRRENQQVIRIAEREFLVTLNKNSVEKLYRDPRVKLMKDYEFHHNLSLRQGNWNPYPLSDVRKAKDSEILHIPFSSRANLYDHPTKVFESKAQLDHYFESVRPNGSRDAYKTAILDVEIDFSKKNLVLFSKNEGSGSIRLRHRAALWVDDELVVAIDRYSPNLHTADLAQHFFAYVVDKSIPAIIFQSVNKKSVIKNVASEFD